MQAKPTCSNAVARRTFAIPTPSQYIFAWLEFGRDLDRIYDFDCVIPVSGALANRPVARTITSWGFVIRCAASF